MKPPYITQEYLTSFIASALAEDIGSGDHSTLASVPAPESKQAQLLIKEEGILAGVALAQEIFAHYDAALRMEVRLQDSTRVQPGDVAFTVSGPAQSILTTERLVLNCMQRMSGIATITQRLCRLLEGTKARLLDTRKTTPNFRLMEKWAVRIGGGYNHRMGLYDMVMLKDNHIDMAGGIGPAIQRTKEYLRARQLSLKIEVETRNLAEVEQVLAEGVDMIMLDNMSMAEMREAVKRINGVCETEASGGITERNLREVAETGVDYISLGMLTHSAKSLDMSLKAC